MGTPFFESTPVRLHGNTFKCPETASLYVERLRHALWPSCPARETQPEPPVHLSRENTFGKNVILWFFYKWIYRWPRIICISAVLWWVLAISRCSNEALLTSGSRWRREFIAALSLYLVNISLSQIQNWALIDGVFSAQTEKLFSFLSMPALKLIPSVFLHFSD